MTIDFFSGIEASVVAALAEDIGAGDLTASLIPETRHLSASVITRQEAIVCGRPWVDEVFQQIDREIQLEWLVTEGESVAVGDTLFFARGSARNILTAERTALNYLQLLSATATRTRYFVALIEDLPAQLLDTRKTIPGLRLAQKYAVHIGAAQNHRTGLFDAFLIKENHIKAVPVTQLVALARARGPGARVEVEVENPAELRAAIAAAPDWIMLDNFTIDDIHLAVKQVQGTDITLEASGGIDTPEQLREIAATGVHFISLGTLTKDCEAIDLSMQFKDEGLPG